MLPLGFSLAAGLLPGLELCHRGSIAAQIWVIGGLAMLGGDPYQYGAQ